MNLKYQFLQSTLKYKKPAGPVKSRGLLFIKKILDFRSTSLVITNNVLTLTGLRADVKQ